MSLRIKFLLAAVVAVLASLALLSYTERMRLREPIRIGVIHSLTGTMALNESPLVDAISLAVEEINAQGGLLGRRVEMVVADTNSDAQRASIVARRLIDQDQVSVLFGCWTSSCRKAIKPVVEKLRHLLVYSVQYEGMESSPNIIYAGAVPNQQIIPSTTWALQKFGPRAYLVGSNYVFPRTANRIIRDVVVSNNGDIVGEQYVSLGEKDVSDIVQGIARAKPNVIFNSLNGDSNQSLFAALQKANLSHVPIVSFSVAEDGMRAWGGNKLRQHYAAWSYFQSLPGEENQVFVAAFKQRFGAERLITDPMVATYVSVKMWAAAVAEVQASDVAAVNSAALLMQTYPGPAGVVSVDKESRHSWHMFRMGKVREDGQFEQVAASERALPPQPWPMYRSKADWVAIMKSAEP